MTKGVCVVLVSLCPWGGCGRGGETGAGDGSLLEAKKQHERIFYEK